QLRLTLVRFGARQLRFRLLKLRLSLRQLAVRLGELSSRLVRRGLKWTRIHLEKQLALLDEKAFRIVLREQVAGDLGADGGIHHAVQGSYPLAIDRDVFLLDRGDLHLGRRRSACPCRTATAARELKGDGAEQ